MEDLKLGDTARLRTTGETGRVVQKTVLNMPNKHHHECPTCQCKREGVTYYTLELQDRSALFGRADELVLVRTAEHNVTKVEQG